MGAAEEAETVLRALGERDDIIKRSTAAMGQAAPTCALSLGEQVPKM